MKLPIYDTQAKKIGEMDSPFNGSANPAVVSQAVTMYLANARCGLAATKTRGEVSGGGKKPWKQKGTGRARAGSTRSPLWRHGGVVFGTHPRDFSYQLSPRIRNLALLSALNEKSAQGDILVLDKIELTSPKAGELEKLISGLGAGHKSLIVLASHTKNLKMASGNMPGLKLALSKDINAYDVVKARKLLFVKESLLSLSERLSGVKS
jgi:large subunit ribosomal protein L4